MEKIWFFIYQYIVLIAVIGLLTFAFIKTNEFNDMLLGALIGVMIQIPASKKSE